MNKVAVHAGDIFCIPLFMPKDDWKLKAKLSDNDLDKDFAFGRVIETSSSVLVEIFKKIGSAQTCISEFGRVVCSIADILGRHYKKAVAHNRENRRLRQV